MRRVTIVNDGDVWLVDLTKRIAEHRVDPGPSRRFRAPVLPSQELPAPLDSLEFGREGDFLRQHGGEPTTIELTAGRKQDRYEIAQHGLTFVFLTDPVARTPRTLEILGQEGLLTTIVYQDYETDLPLDPSLFSPPEGLRVFERRPEPAAGSDPPAAE